MKLNTIIVACLAAQQQLIGGEQAVLASQISLYKVLGGGWQNPAIPFILETARLLAALIRPNR